MHMYTSPISDADQLTSPVEFESVSDQKWHVYTPVCGILLSLCCAATWLMSALRRSHADTCTAKSQNDLNPRKMYLARPETVKQVPESPIRTHV